MADEEKGTPTEEETEETPTEEESSGEENTEDSQELTQAQKVAEDQRKRAEKAEKEAKQYKEQLAKAEKKATQSQPVDDSEWKERVDFLMTNKEVNKDELETISAFAKGKGVSLEDAYADEDVKSFIEQRRQKVAQEQGTPEPTSRTPSVNKKSPAEMSNAEIKANKDELYRQAVEAAKQNRGM